MDAFFISNPCLYAPLKNSQPERFNHAHALASWVQCNEFDKLQHARPARTNDSPIVSNNGVSVFENRRRDVVWKRGSVIRLFPVRRVLNAPLGSAVV